MKCPKCGFVSYPGVLLCKKCGHRFVTSAPKPRTSTLGLIASEPAAPARTVAGPPPRLPARDEARLHPAPPAATSAPVPNAVAEMRIENQPPRRVDLEQEESLNSALAAGTKAVSLGGTEDMESPQPGDPPAWREEVAERVDRFRRRRARLRSGSESLSLDLDFEGARTAAAPDLDHDLHGTGERVDAGSPSASESAKLDSLRLGPPRGAPAVNRAPLDVAMEAHSGSPSAASAWDTLDTEAGQAAAPEAGAAPHAPVKEWVDDKGPTAAPVEIVLESDDTAPTLGPQASTAGEVRTAPLGPRFLAGLVDGGLLLAAAALFAGTLWAADVRLSSHPVNVAILAFIAVFLFLTYFGSFTALTAATPGLAAVGIKVCNLEGAPPTGQESWWRAFGYLVSASAMLLGFVWALLDTEGLTWHDRMSGTYLVQADGK